MSSPIVPPFDRDEVNATVVGRSDLGKIYTIGNKEFMVVKAHAAITNAEVRSALTDGAFVADGDVIAGTVASEALAHNTPLNDAEDYLIELVTAAGAVVGEAELTASTSTLAALFVLLNTALEAGTSGITTSMDADGVQIVMTEAVAAYQGALGNGLYIRVSNVADPEAVLVATSAVTTAGYSVRSNSAGQVLVWQDRAVYSVNVTTTAASSAVAGFVPSTLTVAIAANDYFLMQVPRNRGTVTAIVDESVASGDLGKIVTTSTSAGLVTVAANTTLTTPTIGFVAGTAAGYGSTLLVVTL